MVSITQAAGTLAKSVAFSALNKFDTLNSFVNRVTSGRVNRDSLATSIFHKAIALGTDYVQENPTALGSYRNKAELVPLARQALINNDMEQMKTSVSTLAKKLLGDYIGTDETGIRGTARQLASSYAGSAAERFAESYIGDHAGEKLLATLVKKHGWDSIKTTLSDASGGGFTGKLVSKLITNIMQRAVVDNDAFDMRANQEYDLAADLLHSYLSGKSDYDTRLRDYAPRLMAIKDAGTSAIAHVQKQLNEIQSGLNIAPTPKPAKDVYEKELEGPPKPLVVTSSTTPSDLAKDLVINHLRQEQSGSKDTTDTKQRLTSQLAKLDPEHHQQMKKVSDHMSREQIAPLDGRLGINVAHTWGGSLARIETQNHQVALISDQATRNTVGALTGASQRTIDVGGYRVGEAFANQIKALNLDMDGVGYYDSTLEGGKAALNTAWSWLGFDSEEPDWTDSTTLKQLYNTCNQNAGLMQEVTRYLDADLAKSAIGNTMLRSLGGSDPNTLIMNDKRIELNPDKQPQVQFQVHNDGSFVRVSIDVHYHVDAYGTEDDMRTPVGDNDSLVTASTSLLIKPGQDDASPTTDVYPMGILTSIFNTLNFDHTTNELSDTA